MTNVAINIVAVWVLMGCLFATLHALAVAEFENDDSINFNF